MTTPVEEMPGADDEHATGVPRPRGLVLGSFAAINAAVLLSAGLLRRRTPATPHRRRAGRATTPAAA